MKSGAKFVLVLVCLFVALVACGPVTAVPSVTPTAKVEVTTVSQPLVTSVPDVTPETINGPEKDILDYQLQTWSQEKAISQIESIKKLIDDEKVEYYDIPPVSLSKLQAEYVLRHPEFSAQNNVLWEIARNDPKSIIMPDAYGQTDLLAFLVADVLNKNKTPLTDLADELSLKNIWIDGALSIKNGLGEATDVEYAILHIGGDYPNGKAVYSIWKENELYRVERVNEWDWGGHIYYSLHDGGDVNRNGIHELVLQRESGQSGDPGYSDEVLDFYEWLPAAGEFEFHQRIPVFAQSWDEGPAEGEWEFRENSDLFTRGFWNAGDNCPQITIEHNYRWDGKQYISQGVRVSPSAPAEPVSCRFGWADSILYRSELGWGYDDAIEILDETINRWPQDFDEQWGPAIRDYFKLQLGLWRDLRGEEKQAQGILEDLSKNPTVPEFDLPSRLAAMYLAERDRTGFAKACLITDAAYTDELEKLYPDGVPPDFSLMLQKWGFVNPILSGWSGLCLDTDSLPVALKVSRLKDISLVPVWLTKNGFKWYQKFEVDFNDDGWTDLLMSVDTYDDNDPGVWIFFQTDDGVEAILPDRFGPFLSIQVSGSNSSNFRMTLLTDPNWAYSENSTFAWSKERKLFQEVDDVLPLQLQIEEQIFRNQNYAAAIQAIDKFLKTYVTNADKMKECGDMCSRWYIPYFRYLFGISYELSGHTEQAKQTYYELWRDYPKNMFGLAAMYKLEPINP